MGFSKKRIRLGGTDEYVVVGNVLGFERTDTFSLTGWAATAQPSGAAMLVSKLDNASPNVGYDLYIDVSSDRLLFHLINNITTNRITVTSADGSFPNDGQIRHFAVTYDGSSTAAGVTFYVNGVPVAKNAPVQDNLSASVITTTPLQFGARDGANHILTGDLDDIGIYDIELSASEMLEIARAPDLDTRDLTGLSTSTSLVGFWKCGDGDTFPTLTDSGSGTNDGTMTNMEAGDIVDNPDGPVSELHGEEGFPHPASASPRGQGILGSGMQSWGTGLTAPSELNSFQTSPSALVYDGEPFLGVSPPGDAEGLGNILSRGRGLSYADISVPPEVIGGGADLIVFFKMRALADPGPGFITWKVQDEADYLGALAGAAIIPGSAIVASRWTNNT